MSYSSKYAVSMNTSEPATGVVAIVENVGRKNTGLDLSGSKTPAGTPILSYPIHKTPTKNQAWLLEYLEGPRQAPEPPVPEPPAPEPIPPTRPKPECDFPETNQQALRGNIVLDCFAGQWSSRFASNAQECYNMMKPDYPSYVFASWSDPGSPGTEFDSGDCHGFSSPSYVYFLGNSSGTGFGGDLTLPYENDPKQPEPPAPSCNFEEAPLQAVRGNIVEGCDQSRFGHTVAQSAQECYDTWQEDRGPYGIQSYVFSSAVDPGSPNGDGEWGDCVAYKKTLGYYFVANASGTAFGGDLSVPYPTPPASVCDFNEADQQAVRGNVVQDCAVVSMGQTYMPSSQACYDEWIYWQTQGYPEISSYVFYFPEPGHDSGACHGYTKNSGHYLVADSSGNALGGDLSLPYGGPTAPPRCNYHEGDQQAVRGTLDENCAHSLYGSSKALTAQECYNTWKSLQVKYPDEEILSYVFWSALDPGSPNGFGDQGECRAYKVNSGYYFVADSSGNAFGGDLSMPYESLASAPSGDDFGGEL
ncbi:MAG: hypothetical protein Q9174_002981 [Haloplaca sp. 1 TL-2023]